MTSEAERTDPAETSATPPPDASKTSAARATSDVVLQVLARGLNALLGVAVTIALVRGLGTRGFGEWSTLLSILSIVGYLGSLGLNDVALRHAALDPEHERIWISAVVSLQLLLSIPVAIGALVVGVALTSGPAQVAAVLLACTCLFSAIGSVRVVFQLRVRNSWNAAFELANGLLWAAAVLTISALGGGIIAFAAAFLGTAAAVQLSQFALARREVRFSIRGRSEQRRELIRVGVPFAIASVLYLAYTQIDQVLVYQLAGARDAGLYGAANRMLDRALIIPLSIVMTMFPMIASAYRDDIARMRQLVQTTAEVVLTATVPFVCLVAVIATPLMSLMFGPQFAAAGPALTVFMIVFAITGFSFVAGDLVILLGLQRRYILYAGLGLVVNVALNILLIPPYGFLAAAWVSLGTELVVVGLALTACLRAVPMRLRFGRIVRVGVTSAAGGAAAWGARELGFALVPIGAVWLVATAAAWVLIRPWSIAEVRGVLRRRG